MRRNSTKSNVELWPWQCIHWFSYDEIIFWLFRLNLEPCHGQIIVGIWLRRFDKRSNGISITKSRALIQIDAMLKLPLMHQQQPFVCTKSLNFNWKIYAAGDHLAKLCCILICVESAKFSRFGKTVIFTKSTMKF